MSFQGSPPPQHLKKAKGARETELVVRLLKPSWASGEPAERTLPANRPRMPGCPSRMGQALTTAGFSRRGALCSPARYRAGSYSKFHTNCLFAHKELWVSLSYFPNHNIGKAFPIKGEGLVSFPPPGNLHNRLFGAQGPDRSLRKCKALLVPPKDTLPPSLQE